MEPHGLNLFPTEAEMEDFAEAMADLQIAMAKKHSVPVSVVGDIAVHVMKFMIERKI